MNDVEFLRIFLSDGSKDVMNSIYYTCRRVGWINPQGWQHNMRDFVLLKKCQRAVGVRLVCKGIFFNYAVNRKEFFAFSVYKTHWRFPARHKRVL